MAGQNYYSGGVQGLTGIAASRKWGDTPGADAIFKYNENGVDKFWVPSSYGAGNNWSSASLDPSKMQGLGGMAKSFSTSQAQGGQYNQNYAPKSYEGYSFDTMPDISSIEEASSFNPGKGGNVFMDTWAGPLAVATAALGGSMLGPGSGGTSAISGGGTSALSSAAPGGALATGTGGAAAGGGGMLGSAIPAYTPAMNATGAALGGNASIGGIGAAGSLGTAAGATSNGIFGGSLSGVNDFLSGITGKEALGIGLGVTDAALRYKQGEDLKDIANQSADRADALKQPERQPYQGLLTDYLVNGKPLTDQPMIKANRDMASRDMDAKMAQWGMTGNGMAPAIHAKYVDEAMNASAMPYLQQLSGMAGFGFGPGYSGQLYGNYASQASGVPSYMLESLGRSAGYAQPQSPWQQSAYNAQQQMMGMGPGSNWRWTV